MGRKLARYTTHLPPVVFLKKEGSFRGDGTKNPEDRAKSRRVSFPASLKGLASRAQLDFKIDQ